MKIKFIITTMIPILLAGMLLVNSKATANSLNVNQCKLYESKIYNYIYHNEPNHENTINDFYNKCGNYASSPKSSVSTLYYQGLAKNYEKNMDWSNAIKYYNKLLNFNNSLNYLIHRDLSICYYKTWEMEKAKEHMLIFINSNNRIKDGVPVSAPDYEILGDMCYNIKNYDDAVKYWKLALSIITNAKKNPYAQNNPKLLQNILEKENNLKSKLNGEIY